MSRRRGSTGLTLKHHCIENPRAITKTPRSCVTDNKFEELRSGKRKIVALDSLDHLPRLLIQARIASGLTQEQLADRLGVKPQQIQRYEATDYHSASIDRMIDILHALGARLHHPLELRVAS